ncbi:ABC transporter ATP-binding protein [Nonomuraea basaltis]|uniref:ABC transporter ATP-binding protein n=1 Tax=Nonomuraea basaltis TaxID=2495887 RepID=UPI00110C70C7|nr:ABC transporter ATP-binding protein [Nonomuraea basaltis]TMR93835.1 ATP-binding cassette domain-containing protein [Nonomuraea basaltis]
MSITPLSLPQPPAKAPEFGQDALIVCESLVRIYQSGSVEVQALQGLDLVVDSGEMVAVVGASGSGKSTLLSILAGVDAPTAGRVRVDQWNLLDMSRADRVRYRRHTVGLVRQQTAANLIPYLTARQMVDLPMTAARTPGRVRRRRAAELLDLLGVAECAERRPAQLSGGQQMRVAIAVALANEPRVLLADEPTGELDSATSAAVFGVLREINRRLGVTVVIVTHDPAVSGQVERTVAIRDGRTSSEVLRRTTTGDDGAPQVIAEEYAVMDRAGRIQVPRDYREALALTRRVRLVLEADHIAIRPDGGGAG